MSGPVTEIALLRLKHPLSAPTAVPPSVLKTLTRAASQQTSYSGHSVTLYHVVEDPQLIYLIGGWASVATHMNDWIPSATNQELMGLLTEDVEVEWMFHVSAPPADVQEVIARDGAVVAVGRHTLKPGTDMKEDFQRVFDENRHVLEEFIGGAGNVVGGWRLDQGYDPSSAIKSGTCTEHADEFVLFSVWPSVERHFEFPQAQASQDRYARIMEFVEGFEVRHGMKLNLGLA